MQLRTRQYRHCVPSPVAQRLLWHVLRVGQTGFTRRVRYEAFLKPGAVLLWIRSGAGSLWLGDTALKLEPGKFWLISLDQPRVFAPQRGRAMVLFAVRFSGPGLHSWLDELRVSSDPEFELRGGRSREIQRAYRALWSLARGGDEDRDWEAHEVLSGVLRRLLESRRVLGGRQRQLPAPIRRALVALEARPMHDWKARELAQAAKVSYSTLRPLFRRHMGYSVHEHLQRRRLDLVQALLSDPRAQIKSIVERTHFASESYFSYFFRRRTGMTPTQFRKRLGVSGG